jgi:hypothetical protein
MRWHVELAMSANQQALDQALAERLGECTHEGYEACNAAGEHQPEAAQIWVRRAKATEAAKLRMFAAWHQARGLPVCEYGPCCHVEQR